MHSGSAGALRKCKCTQEVQVHPGNAGAPIKRRITQEVQVHPGSASALRKRRCTQNRCFFLGKCKSSRNPSCEGWHEQPWQVKADDFGHVKDNGNNTFRGLRLLNATHDVAYFEFADIQTDWNFTRPPFFCEMYDVAADPDQLDNLCAHAPADTLRRELAMRLEKEYRCSGDECE